MWEEAVAKNLNIGTRERGSTRSLKGWRERRVKARRYDNDDEKFDVKRHKRI